MCGITGFLDYRKKSDSRILSKMVAQLQHRGPDDRGNKVWEEDTLNIGFGHTRLSIIELSKLGHQPMFDETEKYAIIFNGEVYNYEEIKKELESQGIKFRSNSDTEVVLKAFIQWGENAVHKFIGMFAFAIYDISAKKIFLFRDRAGVKPLFYYWNEEVLLFGSELKSFHQHPDFKKEIDLSALSNYLKLGYVPAPQSIFKKTQKLKQAHFLIFDIEQKSFEEREYWSLKHFYNSPKRNLSLNQAIDEFEPLVYSACKYRMVSDVPVGIFLSGGYDSTLITSILQKNSDQKLNTFSIGFEDDRYNEAHYAKDTANYLGTNHTEFYCSFKDVFEIIEQLPSIYDEPFADSSALPTTLVSSLASKKVKVALSADGGDELLGGYDRYVSFKDIYEKINKIPYPLNLILSGVLKNTPKSLISSLANVKYLNKYVNSYQNYTSLNFKARSILSSKNFSDCIIDLSKSIVDDEVKLMMKDKSLIYSNNLESFQSNYFVDESFNDIINQMLAFDYATILTDDFCVKVDRASMSQGLESREPLLDHRLFEWAAGISSELKVKDGVQKYLLKEITHKYVPKHMLDRPKKGFEIPIKFWLREYMQEEMEEVFSIKYLKEQGIFDVNYINSEYKKYLNKQNTDFRKIWFLFVFQQWYKKWM